MVTLDGQYLESRHTVPGVVLSHGQVSRMTISVKSIVLVLAFVGAFVALSVVVVGVVLLFTRSKNDKD